MENMQDLCYIGNPPWYITCSSVKIDDLEK